MANLNPSFDVSKIIRCGTPEYMRRLKVADPTLQSRLNEYENIIQENIKSIQMPISPTTDTICYKQNKGAFITLPYNGVARQWKLISDAGGNYCYKVQL